MNMKTPSIKGLFDLIPENLSLSQREKYVGVSHDRKVSQGIRRMRSYGCFEIKNLSEFSRIPSRPRRKIGRVKF